MAINIREILHPSDSDSIKFEKINYNFDQILANGGGPRGQKGQKGQQGNLGLTGEKGIKGDQGDQGIKGDTGTTNTPWFSVDPAVDSTYKILKPKRLGLTYTPVIFLGDDSFDETTLVDGINTGLNSKITIKKDSIAFDNYITLLDDVSGEKLSVTGSYDSNSSITRFAIQNAFQSQNIQFAINVDQLDFDSSGLTTITGGGGVTLQSGGGNSIKLETLGTGIVDVDANAEFKGYVRLNNSSDPTSPQAGMIRYNSVNNKFEGYFASNEWKELCTECGSAVPNSITIGGGNIDANADGTPVNNNSISIGGGNTPSGDIDANADGTPVGSVTPTPTSTPTSTPVPTPIETGTMSIHLDQFDTSSAAYTNFPLAVTVGYTLTNVPVGISPVAPDAVSDNFVSGTNTTGPNLNSQFSEEDGGTWSGTMTFMQIASPVSSQYNGLPLSIAGNTSGSGSFFYELVVAGGKGNLNPVTPTPTATLGFVGVEDDSDSDDGMYAPG